MVVVAELESVTALPTVVAVIVVELDWTAAEQGVVKLELLIWSILDFCCVVNKK